MTADSDDRGYSFEQEGMMLIAQVSLEVFKLYRKLNG